MQKRNNVVADTGFFRFPHTPHLAWLGTGASRDDKVLSLAEAKALLTFPVRIEEKIDGANLGISLSEDGDFQLQNRGQYLRQLYRGQFARLDGWLQTKAELLFDAINPNLMIFGEWCAARHSLGYDLLPDWWMVFDVYDRAEGCFWSACRRDSWAADHGLATVATLQIGKFTLQNLTDMVCSIRSRYRKGILEGIVVRSDEAMWNLNRAKLVRADFVQGIGEHWRNRPIDWNHLKIDE